MVAAITSSERSSLVADGRIVAQPCHSITNPFFLVAPTAPERQRILFSPADRRHAGFSDRAHAI
jgi:hypothetical protein